MELAIIVAATSALFCFLRGSEATNAVTMDFIGDFLRFKRKVMPSTTASAFICWELEIVEQLIQHLSQKQVILSAHPMTQHTITQLRATGRNNHVTFVVDVNCKGAATLLQEANRLSMFNGWSRWLLLENVQLKNTSMFTENEINMTDGEEFVNHEIQDNGYMSLKSFNESELYNKSSLKKNTKGCSSLVTMLKNLNVLSDSDVTVGSRVSEERFLLYEVYKEGSKMPLKNDIGYWEKTTGIQFMTSMILSTRRSNVHRSQLKAVMVVTNNDTFLHLTDTVNKHIDTISKVNYALFRHVVDIINASVEMTVVDTWGYAVNGTWNGLSGYLQRGEADIGATGMFVTKNRLSFLTYIASTTPTRAAFIFRQPPLSFVENIFTLPFSRSVWLSSAGLIAIMGVLLYGALKWEFRQNNNQDMNGYLMVQPTWSDMVLLALGAVCQQSTLIEAQGIAGRIITFFLFITVIFLYTSYSACIVALLQSSTLSIRTLNDLLHSGLTLGAHDIIYNRHYFSIVNDPVRRAIYTKKVNPPEGPERFLPLDEGLERVRKGLFAFHLELGSGYKVISDTFLEEEKCNLQTITFLIEIPDPWVAVSKVTPYKEILTVGYRKVHERGLQHRENLKFYHNKPECVSRGTSFVSVGIVDCYPALLVLVYGVLMSFVILLIEIIAHRRRVLIMAIG